MARVLVLVATEQDATKARLQEELLVIMLVPGDRWRGQECASNSLYSESAACRINGVHIEGHGGRVHGVERGDHRCLQLLDADNAA